MGLVALLVVPTLAQSALITLHEAALDAIFSQASFGENTIDIRFNDAKKIHNGNLQAIDSEAEWNTLVGLAPEASPTVNLFFLDGVNWCGSTGIWAGCGQHPGNVIAVNATMVAGQFGAEIIAHELGHNLGLDHFDDVPNLMHSTTYGNTSLDAAQAASILQSALVQTDAAGKRYIAITPILVPEPQVLALMLCGLFLVFRLYAVQAPAARYGL